MLLHIRLIPPGNVINLIYNNIRDNKLSLEVINCQHYASEHNCPLHNYTSERSPYRTLSLEACMPIRVGI